MAVGTGCIDGAIMQTDPFCIKLCIGFRPSTYLNIGDKILRGGYHRDGMAEVAFQADGLILGIQVFPIMTSETTRRVDVTKVVGMSGPIDFLVDENSLVINILKFLYRRGNQMSIFIIETGIVLGVVIFETCNARHCFSLGSIR